MSPENLQEAFDRGAAAGRRDARLDGHDDQLKSVTTGLGALSDQMRGMGDVLTGHITGLTLKVQELSLNAASSASSTLMLAEGVEKERSNAAAAILKEKNEEKDKDEKHWTPFSRFMAGLAAVVSVALLILALLALFLD